MPNQHSTSRSFPFDAAFSPSERQRTERAFRKQEEQRRTDSASRGDEAQRISEGVERQLHDLLGTRKYAALRDGIRQERLGLRDLMQPPEGLKRDLSKQKAVGRRNVDSLIRKLGANRAKVDKILRAADARVRDLLLPDHRKVALGLNLTKNLAQWTKLSPLHTLPLPWGTLPPLDDPNDPHRWFLFRPPFFGFLFSQDSVATSNFRVDRLMILHPPSGLVGNECTMDCDDAGGWDLADIIGETQIAFAFTPPVTGVIEVLIDAQSTICTHEIEIEDEFGFSDAQCTQQNYLMMNVLHPNVPVHSLALMSILSKETDGDDLSVSQETLTRGQHYYAQLFSSGPVVAGQSVIITVGTRTLDVCRTNDMELHSKSHFEWFINSVEARISP